MGKPDALFQCADHGKYGGDNKGIVLLTLEVFCIHALRATLVRGPKREIMDDIRECFNTLGLIDQPVAEAARQLYQDWACGTVVCSEWDKLDSLLTFGSRIYVPDSKDL